MFDTGLEVTLKHPDVGGQVLQCVEGEAEPGAIIARQAWFCFQGDCPIHRTAFGVRQTIHHFDIQDQLSKGQTPDL